VASIYARGKRLWCSLKNERGEWICKRTPYFVGNEREATKYAELAQKVLDRRRATVIADGPLTVSAYADYWLEDRRTRGVGSAGNEEAHLKKHALPHLGSLRLDEVNPVHVRDMVRVLRKNEIAPRTVLHVFGTLHNMFENAEIEGKVPRNPVKVKKGELPAKVDKDPEWRANATFTVAEVERLISDARIPVERRVLYALKAIAGLRHGEAAALRWRHYDREMEPLGRLIVAVAYNSDRRVEKSTKTGTTRYVPAHPALAKILAVWKISHWARIYGRAPTSDDFIVPARTMRPLNKSDMAHAMKEDLAELGLRIEAGKHRSRGGHDLRAWFKTRAVEDGADSVILRRVTHAPPKDVESGYLRFSWAVYCREVAKIRISAESRGQVLELSTDFSTAEQRARNRWRKVVTPPGLEPGIAA